MYLHHHERNARRTSEKNLKFSMEWVFNYFDFTTYKELIFVFADFELRWPGGQIGSVSSCSCWQLSSWAGNKSVLERITCLHTQRPQVQLNKLIIKPRKTSCCLYYISCLFVCMVSLSGSAILYLNDDFSGGELFFTKRDAKTVTVSYLLIFMYLRSFLGGSVNIGYFFT